MAGCSVCQTGNIDGVEIIFTVKHHIVAVGFACLCAKVCFVNCLREQNVLRNVWPVVEVYLNVNVKEYANKYASIKRCPMLGTNLDRIGTIRLRRGYIWIHQTKK